MSIDRLTADAATVLPACYLLTNLAFSVMYVPRLRRILVDEAAALQSNSLSSEVFWLLCRFVAIAYVGSVAQQVLIACTIVLDILGRTAIVAVLVRARVRVSTRERHPDCAPDRGQ